ncbi:MAG TPA: histidinol-phosphate transaminase [Acidimicrobiales bacterium]|jgi:histidinol-phosphate aminotransferase
MSDGPRDRIEVRPGLDMVSGYHSPQLDVDVRLNTNESPEPPPASFLAELAQAARDLEPHRYPDRRAERLRRAIGAHHGLAPEQVALGNGSNEVLQAVCLAYGGTQRTAVTFEPTYAMHAHIARVCGTAVVELERGPGFLIEAELAAARLAEVAPHITFLCSPNNPTGVVEPAATIDAVIDAAPGLVVVDEAYGQFAPWSATQLLDEDRPLVVTRTFSKTWAMAGLRLGYLLGPSWLVAELDRVLLPYHIDSLKQAAGLVALDHVEEMEVRVARIAEERGRIASALSDLDVDVVPSGSNFVLFRPRPVDGRVVWERLVERGVLVRDCSGWPRLDGYLRVTVGTPSEGDRFLAAIEDALAAG